MHHTPALDGIISVLPEISNALGRDTPSTLGFEELFDAEYLKLARAMHLLAGDRSEGEDLAQEALAKVYERWNRVREMDSPLGYVYRTQTCTASACGACALSGQAN